MNYDFAVTVVVEWFSKLAGFRSKNLRHFWIYMLFLTTVSISNAVYAGDYDVSGYGFSDGSYVYGEVESDSNGDVEGYIYLENGDQVYIEGEFDGYGEIEAYGDDGNYYELETE